MKKIVLLFIAILFVQTAANAFVENKYMTTAQYMQNTGYSSEMEKMINITAQYPYREPYVEPTTKKDIAKRVYNYLIPGVYNDLSYYNHNINTNNTHWKDW